MDLGEFYNSISSSFVSNFDSNSEYVKWHARLGYVGQDGISRLAKEGLLDRLSRFKFPRYDLCLAGKAIIKPFVKALRASRPLELIHPNIYGRMNLKQHHRVTYFITLIDVIHDIGICTYYLTATRLGSNASKQKYRLNWNENLKLFVLVEVVNIPLYAQKSL